MNRLKGKTAIVVGAGSIGPGWGNGKATAWTSGRWEASAVRWSADGATAYFVCNRKWPGDYEVCASTRGGAVREITALDGVTAVDVDLAAAIDAARIAQEAVGHELPSALLRAGDRILN